MTDGQLVALAIAASIVIVSILAYIIDRSETRRTREITTIAQAPPAAIDQRRPAAVRPTVVLGPPRPIVQAPARGQPLQLPVVLGSPRPIVLAPGQAPALQPVRRGLPLVIPRREDPLWHEKGWRRNGRGYEGSYQAGAYRWRGLIQEPYPGSFAAYIWNPPLAELGRRTSHRPCFNSGGADGRFSIHFHSMPVSIDHSIASIEAVLRDAMGV